MKNPLLKRIFVPAAFFLAGLAACLILLELSLRVAAFLYVHYNSPNASAQTDSRLTVACFGDSFTENGHTSYKERYPAQMQRIFDAAGEKVRVVNYGVCESNSSQTLRRMRRVLKTHHVDYVVLLTGSTNRYNLIGFNDNGFTRFVKELRTVRLAHVFRIYVRDRLLRTRAGHPAFVFDTVGWESEAPTVDAVKAMVRKEPEYENMLWANYYMSQMRFPDALEYLQREKAMGGRGHNPMILVDMGECYEGMGDYPSAERMYQLAAKINPAAGHLALGKHYAQRGKYGMAEKFLCAAAAEQKDMEAYNELGKFYRDRGKYAQAEAAFKRSIENDSMLTAVGEHSLIDLYAECGRYDEAEAEYEKALVRYPEVKDFSAYIYRYLVARGKYVDAMRCYLKALEQKTPPSMFPLFLMTSMFEMQSRYSAQDVLAVLDRAVARNPLLAHEPTFRAYREYFQNKGTWDRKQQKWLKDDLENMAVFCRRKGINLIILNYPFTFVGANDLLADLAKRHGLPFVDLYRQFSELIGRNGKWTYIQSDGHHCTAEGNRIVAESVFKKIQELRAAQGEK